MTTDTSWRCTCNSPPGRLEDGQVVELRDGGPVTHGTFRLDWQDDETAEANVVTQDGAVYPLTHWSEWRPYEEDRARG